MSSLYTPVRDTDTMNSLNTLDTSGTKIIRTVYGFVWSNLQLQNERLESAKSLRHVSGSWIVGDRKVYLTGKAWSEEIVNIWSHSPLRISWGNASWVRPRSCQTEQDIGQTEHPCAWISVVWKNSENPYTSSSRSDVLRNNSMRPNFTEKWAQMSLVMTVQGMIHQT